MAVKADQATEMNVSSNELWNPVHKEKRPEGLGYVFQGITVLPDSSGPRLFVIPDMKNNENGVSHY